MHKRYPMYHLVVLASTVAAHCILHVSGATYGCSGPDLGLSWRNEAVISPWLRISRGGGEESQEGDNDETEQDSKHPLDTSNAEEQASPETRNEEELLEVTQSSTVPALESFDFLRMKRKVRHTSDVIARLVERNSVMSDDSYELRELIAKRAQSYMDDLLQSGDKLPHPRRVLHYIAPKIPAIKSSPDLMLRVQSSRAGIDAGVAACAIGTVARLCELYDRQNIKEDDSDDDVSVSVGSEIVKDRRFQQLVECVLCGVDMRKRKGEAEKMKGEDESELGMELRDIEEVLDEENAEIDEGLSVQDACRAAWGIAILGGFHTKSFSDVATKDILTALSLRSRELLLARLQLLRQGDTQKQDTDSDLTLVELLDQDAESLAEDAASAMWTFACVKACTGVRSVPLFEACCSILCQNPTDLRERAQATKEGLDGSNFELNNVLDKLERSEVEVSNELAEQVNNDISLQADKANETSRAEETFVVAPEDSLLDGLSPNEVTDILWALALHGSNVETDSKEEIALSENAAAFREIAFDRLVVWLRRDIDTIDDVVLHGAQAYSFIPEGIGSREVLRPDDSGAPSDSASDSQGSMMVEVVDAATLLASSATMETELVSTVNDIKVKGVTEVQVVDAATLLAHGPDESSLRTETEVVVTSVIAPSYHHEGSVEALQTVDTFEETPMPPLNSASSSNYREVASDMAALLRSGRLSFSPHDLCSIAWAVTDLRDPLRFLIVDLIAQIFASLGKVSMTDLPVSDLSNLAWAISRSATQNRALSWTEYSDTPSAVVTRWTAECALARLNLDREELEEHDVALAVRSMQKEFQPPEIGRLMWSFACTEANHFDHFERELKRDAAMGRLAELAMLTAGSDPSIFGTEDLARISWAFLELCDTKEALSHPLVADSLGYVLSVIESSLLLWESGKRVKSTAVIETERAQGALHYLTFFGKSRFPLPLLNQRISEHEDDDDESKLHAHRKAALPLLRDLPVDPSSLCKVASGFSELSQSQGSIKGGWTFVRVAVRLLSSKNGQLMEECPIRDVIRLCHACAITRINGREREHVVRLFARRVVHFLNEAFDPDLEAHGRAAARLARASPWEISILIWSLGEMGAKHVTSDENPRMAYRKLHLITDRPLLTEEQLQSLSPASAVNLVHGIVAMNMVSSDPTFVSAALQAFEAKVGSLTSGRELTYLAQTLAKVRSSIASLDYPPKEEGFKNGGDKDGNTNADDAASAAPETEGPEIAPGTREIEHDTAIGELTNEQNTTIAMTAMLESTNRLLDGVAKKAIEKVQELSGAEMRRLLLIYSLIPFQADDLVDAMEEEMNRRMAALEFVSAASRIDCVARNAADKALQASNSLSTRSDSSSPVNTIKNGIKAIFGVHEVSEDISDEDAATMAEAVDTIHLAAALTNDSAERMERMKLATGVDAETLLRGAEQGAALELGRCRELIASYRRIDFPSGSHGGRYDSERRRDTGKRTLSRLFP